MGLDIYFFKFDARGIELLYYQDWFGDVYTEFDVDRYDDYDLFQYIYPQYNLNEYRLGSIYRDAMTFERIDNHDDQISIDSRIMPIKQVVVKKVPVTEIEYFRLGYGGYILGCAEEISFYDLWRNFEKYVQHGDPDARPYLSKRAFIDLLNLPEFKTLSDKIKGRDIDVKNTDFDVAYISW